MLTAACLVLCNDWALLTALTFQAHLKQSIRFSTVAERVPTFTQSILENAKETTRVTIVKFSVFFLAHSDFGNTYRDCTIPFSTSVRCSNNSHQAYFSASQSLTKIWCYCGYSGGAIYKFWIYKDRAQLHTHFVQDVEKLKRMQKKPIKIFKSWGKCHYGERIKVYIIS